MFDRSTASRSARSAPAICEALERRRLLSITTFGVPRWVEQGPHPVVDGQPLTGPPIPVTGAINAAAPDPGNVNRLFIGAVNGGIWRTNDATNPNPTWTPLTDSYPSLSIADIQFSPLDPTHNTLFAAVGSSSSDPGDDPSILTGLLKTTDGGTTWSQFANSGPGSLIGLNLVRVLPLAVSASSAGQVVLVATERNLYRSTDGGRSFTLIKDIPLYATAYSQPELTVDPGNPNRVYAAIPNQGFYRSDDAGATWTLKNDSVIGSLAASTGVYAARITVHNDSLYNVVYAGLWKNQQPLGVWYSATGGDKWYPIEPIKGGGHFKEGSLIADPANPYVVFAAGGADGIFRGNIAAAPGSVWTPVYGTGANGTAPHADSRRMTFDAAGNLIDCDDGGIYRLVNPDNLPGGPPRQWNSPIGNLCVGEVVSTAYDSVNHSLVVGQWDNGDNEQGPSTWHHFNDGDGNTVAVDNSGSQSIRYATGNSALKGFFRRSFDATGKLVPGSLQPLNMRISPASAPFSGLTDADAKVNLATIPFAINAVDPSRLVLGLNSLYESFDRGETITDITPAGAFGVPGPVSNLGGVGIAYGGRLGGMGYANVLYVGVGNKLYFRPADASVAVIVPSYPGFGARRILLDPDDYHHAFVLDEASQVFQTTDSGSTWTNVTGNLDSLGSDFRTIELYKNGSAFVLLAGGVGGVYRCINPDAWAVWTRFGTGLPQTLVTNLVYNYADDVLIAGTFGRGDWTLPNASDTLTQTSFLSVIENNNILLQLDANNPLNLNVYTNSPPRPPSSTPAFSVELADLREIDVNALGNILTVDNGNGLIAVPGGIHFQGGLGSLIVLGTPTSQTYSITGSSVSVGRANIVYAGAGFLEVAGGIEGANTFNVLSTSVPTDLFGGGNGNTNFVTVGQDHLTAGVAGTLDIDAPGGGNIIVVDDSKDTTFRSWTQSTITPLADTPYGSITGLSPAAINYEYDDTTTAQIHTGWGGIMGKIASAAVRTEVLGSGGPSHESHDRFYVGSNGGLQGITAPLALNSAGGAGEVTFDDSGNFNTADSPTITPTQVGGPNDRFFGQGAFVTYSGITLLDVKLSQSQIGNNVRVTPGNTDITIEGNPQTVQLQSGDTLTLNLNGIQQVIFTPTAPFSGQYSFANAQPVSYSNIHSATQAPIAPAVASAAYHYDHLPHTVTITFVGDVTSGLSALQVINVINNTLVAPATYSYNANTRTATFAFSGALPSGTYAATLRAAGVADASGNHLVSDYHFSFFFQAGDVNHDGVVNFADLVILARNYGNPQATYSQGDLDYDGKVDFKDLVIVARNYGHSIGAASPAAQSAGLLRALTPDALLLRRAKPRRPLVH